MSGHKTIHITEPPFYQIMKIRKDVEIVGAEISLINFVLVRVICL